MAKRLFVYYDFKTFGNNSLNTCIFHMRIKKLSCVGPTSHRNTLFYRNIPDYNGITEIHLKINEIDEKKNFSRKIYSENSKRKLRLITRIFTGSLRESSCRICLAYGKMPGSRFLGFFP